MVYSLGGCPAWPGRAQAEGHHACIVFYDKALRYSPLIEHAEANYGEAFLL